MADLLDFRPLDARLGNYDDCYANQLFQQAAAWLFVSDMGEYMTGWRPVRIGVTQFRFDTAESCTQQWTVVYEADIDGISIKSVLIEQVIE